MLVTGWLIILSQRDSITRVDLLHGQSDFLCNIKHPMTLLCRQSVKTLEMVVRHDNYMSGVFAHKEGIYKGANHCITINEVRLSNECVWTVVALQAKAYWTLVVITGIAFRDHDESITNCFTGSRFRTLLSPKQTLQDWYKLRGD